MPPVKKPKPQKINNISSAKTHATLPSENVVSGQLKKKLKKAESHKNQQIEKPERGVVFIKHLPHGFFEEQLRKYFEQFGHVTRLRLVRSKRTGGSKGFAFIEFEYPEVAKVAADTMDNYLMFQKVVKASYIPPSEQNLKYFKSSVKKVTNNAGKEIYVSSITKAATRNAKKQNNWNESNCQKRTVSTLKKLRKIQSKYVHLGIDFSSVIVEPVKKTKAAPESKPKATTSDLKPIETQAKNKTTKKELKLEDLLGNTLIEDSEDEDYVDVSETDESEEEEEFDEEASDDEVDESESDEDIPKLMHNKKAQKKNTGVERFAELLKRKPGTGAIQKKKILTIPKLNNKKSAPATRTLQLAQAKKVAKPLQKANKAKKLKK